MAGPAYPFLGLPALFLFLEAQIGLMWMTSPDTDRPTVERIAAGTKQSAGKAGAGPAVDPDYIRLLHILDQFPEIKRQVIEALSKKG